MSGQVATFWKRIVEPFFSITDMASMTPTAAVPSPAGTSSAEVAPLQPAAAAPCGLGTGTTSAEASLAPEADTAPASSASSSMDTDTGAGASNGAGGGGDGLPSQPSGLEVLAQSTALLDEEEARAGGARERSPEAAPVGRAGGGRMKARFDETDDDETLDAGVTDGSGRYARVGALHL
jgi:hypothetical protein